MKLLQNWGTLIMVFLLTLVLGYYLGLAISTTVDYKLQDIQLKLPRPKNNITIEIIKKPKKKYKINAKKNQINKIDNKSNNVKVDKNEDINVSVESKTVEKFSNYTKKKDKKRKKNKKVKKETFKSEKNCNEPNPFNPVLDQRARFYNIKEQDKALAEYANNYRKYRKMEKKQEIGNLVAYNHEDIETSYFDYDLNIDCKKRPEKKSKEKMKIKPRKYINLEEAKNIEKSSNNWDSLPTRDKLCPGFKCQRKYLNCTNNHEIVNKAL